MSNEAYGMDQQRVITMSLVWRKFTDAHSYLFTHTTIIAEKEYRNIVVSDRFKKELHQREYNSSNHRQHSKTFKRP